MEQGVEWMLQRKPSFTLIHTAAFNGHLDVIQFLEQEVGQLKAKVAKLGLQVEQTVAERDAEIERMVTKALARASARMEESAAVEQASRQRRRHASTCSRPPARTQRPTYSRPSSSFVKGPPMQS